MPKSLGLSPDGQMPHADHARTGRHRLGPRNPPPPAYGRPSELRRRDEPSGGAPVLTGRPDCAHGREGPVQSCTRALFATVAVLTSRTSLGPLVSTSRTFSAHSWAGHSSEKSDEPPIDTRRVTGLLSANSTWGI